MIHFEPLISWAWAWLFAMAIVIILGFQLFWIQKSNPKTAKKIVKIALNALLSFILIGYVFQPVWESTQPDEAVLVYSSEMQKNKVAFWKDSLQVKDAIEITKYRGEGSSVYLLGSDFSRVELLKIGGKEIRWVGDFEEGSIPFLEWKGILRQGEKQTLKGRIHSQDSLSIVLTQLGVQVAQAEIAPTSGVFDFEFAAQLLGRNELDLMVNDSLYGRINFFVTAPRPIRYRLQFAFPDPEIRFLGQYLISSGQRVSEQIDISKSTTIRAGDFGTDSLQFLIIDPAQVSKKSTQKAIEEGASVLVMNLGEVGKDISAINKALKTNFKTKRTTTEESREIEPDLETSPYGFEPALAQKLVFDSAFAVQQIGNSKVGVSLLAKTFPIRMGGDSLRYHAIWQKILGAMLPHESAAVELGQPIFNGMTTEIQVSQFEFHDNLLRIGADSVFLQQSLVNPFSKSGSFVSLDTGWVAIGDSLEYYSYPADEWKSLRYAKLRANFLNGRAGKQAYSQGIVAQRRIADWWWLGMLLLVLTVLWLEPKVLN